MKDLRFAWDEHKNKSNRRKHGVSFEEAQTVFYDDHALARKADRTERADYERQRP